MVQKITVSNSLKIKANIIDKNKSADQSNMLIKAAVIFGCAFE